MENFVKDERKYENTMPIGEAPPGLRPETIKHTRLKKKRGKRIWALIKKRY